jgi:8-oxo-dGTP diphosphatase
VSGRRVRLRTPAADAEDAAFLSAYDPAAYPRPSVAVDVVVLSVVARTLVALLVERTEPPQRGRWSLPGGFLHLEESLEHAAARVLADKGGLREVYLEQLFTFSNPARDPRTRVLSVAYYALVEPGRFASAEASQAGARAARVHVPWPGEEGGAVEAHGDDGVALPLAFDHAEILGTAVKRLRGKLAYSPVGFELLGASFTLRQLQDVHEAILGRKLNKDSFRRRVRASGQIEPTGQWQGDVDHRPAQLFRFREAPVLA